MANHNVARLEEDVRREISSAMRELKDRDISGRIVTVSRVELTNDLSYCKVYVSVLGGGNRAEKAAATLKKASGFFKKRINARIKMHKLPELIFLPDNSLDYYDKISRMIDNLPKPAQSGENKSESAAPDGNGYEEYEEDEYEEDGEED